MRALFSIFLAVSAVFATGRAEAVTITTYCESSQCGAGDIDVGSDLYALSGASFGLGDGLVFRGYNRDETSTNDIDRWYFDATTPFTAFIDYFSGPGTGQANIAGPGGTDVNLLNNPITSSFQVGSYSAGSYGFITGEQTVGAFTYRLRVQANDSLSDVPLPSSALLFLTSIIGLWSIRLRRHT
jgi:hypothetical protein